ncbi:MAG: hypothetical protein JWM04_2857 [Verrucomicrobiales bacterium]|jgi:hypothetical protein|nr:hypothetical protein [Verrucomicrobiales bacterium]
MAKISSVNRDVARKHELITANEVLREDLSLDCANVRQFEQGIFKGLTVYQSFVAIKNDSGLRDLARFPKASALGRAWIITRLFLRVKTFLNKRGKLELHLPLAKEY